MQHHLWSFCISRLHSCSWPLKVELRTIKQISSTKRRGLQKTFTKNYSHPKYLGVIVERFLTFRKHAHNCKTQVSTCNNVLFKLTCSRWSSNPHILRTSAFVLCFSAAEYACPVWTRSAHAQHVNSVLIDRYHIIIKCLK